MRKRWGTPWIAALVCSGCTPPGADDPDFGGETSAAPGDSTAAAAETSDPDGDSGPNDDAGPDGEDTGTGDSTDGGGQRPLLDVGGGRVEEPTCTLVDDLDGSAVCDVDAPPGSFDVELQWEWDGEEGAREAVVTPLVINLTDDDGSGTVDLCDTPDIVVTLYETEPTKQLTYHGELYVLDGATGAVHFQADRPVCALTNAAAGDIDDDGLPELVTLVLMPDEYGRIAAFENDGTTKWVGELDLGARQGAVALADLDADGDVEILFRNHVFDHLGELQWSADTEQDGIPVPVAVDLDGDGDLEVIHGASAWHHDGAPYYAHPEIPATSTPAVADVDGDGLPEILVVSAQGVAIIEHDGALTVVDGAAGLADVQPTAIHDLDGDGVPEVLVGAGDAYTALDSELGVQWTATVSDATGYSAGTAFDFLGDATAEAIHADQDTLRVFNEAGEVLLSAPRASWTMNENPVVADVDNDGSAEIVVVSNKGYDSVTAPPVAVFRDVDDRWVPARRIWNQHAYHVTNVREDGSIPDVQPRHWESLNTFRTQSQILPNGTVCRPEG